MASVPVRNAGSPNALPYLINHFTSYACKTLSSHTGQVILHSKVPEMLLRHKFLLHTVLAFSASHLDYLGSGPSSIKRMTKTAAYHSHRAIHLYGDRIAWYQTQASQPRKMQEANSWLHILAPDTDADRPQEEREDMDALVAACMMLTSLFFHPKEGTGMTSWTLSILSFPSLRGAMHTFGAATLLAGGNSTTLPDAIAEGLPPTHSHDMASDTKCSDLLAAVQGHLGVFNDGLRTAATVATSLPAAITLPVSASFPVPTSTFHDVKQLSSKLPDKQQHQINWLTTVTGMSILLALPAFQKNLRNSIWLQFFTEANDQHSPQLDDLDTNLDEIVFELSQEPNVPIVPSQCGLSGLVVLSDDWSDIGTPRSQWNSLPGFSFDCAQVTDPVVDAPGKGCSAQALTKLQRLVGLLARHPCDRMRKQADLVRPLMGYLSYVLSLNASDLDNFAPIISFASRLPPDFPALFESHLDAMSKPRGESDAGGVSGAGSSFPNDSWYIFNDESSFDALEGLSKHPLETERALRVLQQNACTDSYQNAPNFGTPRGDEEQFFAGITQNVCPYMPLYAPPNSTASLRSTGATPAANESFDMSVFTGWADQITGLQYQLPQWHAPPVATQTDSSTESAPATTTHTSTTSTSTTFPHACNSLCPTTQSNTLPLLILGYWFDCLRRVPHWWCADRGRIESDVIEDVLLNGLSSNAGGRRQPATQACPQLGGGGLEGQTERVMREAIYEFVDFRERSAGA
ncbi:uncharacterized protein AB675_10345 [Cyphellophora attinorum]|uniref:Transcription factor domain-containing protein n=1 Tax=Cyphellophora attinorum TaxID=1664694 RepID=A0A0N0NJV6_9EURO|nr:uncharacterized protein AB675_10345 [Phialophora attinorum]KPI37338.1 hypothetical protein AB675_10345 [Phialophora attinorum]